MKDLSNDLQIPETGFSWRFIRLCKRYVNEQAPDLNFALFNVIGYAYCRVASPESGGVGYSVKEFIELMVEQMRVSEQTAEERLDVLLFRVDRDGADRALLQKIPHPTNAARKQIVPTALGREFIEGLEPYVREYWRFVVFGDLPDERERSATDPFSPRFKGTTGQFGRGDEPEYTVS